MVKTNNPIRKLAIPIVGLFIGSLTGFVTYYGGFALLTYFLPVSKILFNARESIIPIIIESLVLVVIIYFGVRINTRIKISIKTLFDNFSKANFQEFIVTEILGGILVGLFLMVMNLMILFSI